MLVPQLSEAQIRKAFPQLTGITKVGQGGQKVVYRAESGGTLLALKFALIPEEVESDDFERSPLGVRASREVQTMRDCDSPHMVKPGPIGLGRVEIAGQRLLYFSEEFIDGQDLHRILQGSGRLGADEAIRLGLDVAEAIDALWGMRFIHRDIKPQNIMRAPGERGFVLLDAGLVFDLEGESLSAGYPVGTLIYFSPEQLSYGLRRDLDFRSDVFSFGVTIYEMLTGVHPFHSMGHNQASVMARIQSFDPPSPRSLVAEIPEALDAVVMRMMSKSPHQRYRKIEHLKTAFEAAGAE